MIIKGYEWLGKIGVLPRLVSEGLKEYGVKETPGKANNPIIMGWAKELGVKTTGYAYTGDVVPWCGLYMAVIAKRAGKTVPEGPLFSLNWMGFGTPTSKPQLGDVLVFVRTGGGHVGIYIAEDDEAYHVLGGNQSDGVNISRVSKKRFARALRPAYTNKLPMSAKPYRVAANGALSTNEK